MIASDESMHLCISINECLYIYILVRMPPLGDIWSRVRGHGPLMVQEPSPLMSLTSFHGDQDFVAYNE